MGRLLIIRTHRKLDQAGSSSWLKIKRVRPEGRTQTEKSCVWMAGRSPSGTSCFSFAEQRACSACHAANAFWSSSLLKLSRIAGQKHRASCSMTSSGQQEWFTAFFFLFNDTSCSGPHTQLIRDLEIPSVEKLAPILWKPEKLQAGMQKYPPDPPFRPEPPFWADDRAAKQKAKSSKNNVITLKVKISFCGWARRAEEFHFPLFFYERAQSGRISMP